MADASVMKFEVKSPQMKPRMLSFDVTKGDAQVETVTLPAFAGAAQADFIVIYNQAGASEALWLDKDAAGTVPTAAAYTAATVKTMVSISTGDLAPAVGAAFAAALATAGITVVDNLDGTVTLTQTVYGDCSNAVPSNAAGSGAGSITVAVGTEGLTAALGNGKFDATLAQTIAGTFVLTFEQPFVMVPEIGITSKSDNRVPRISACTAFAVTIEISNLSGGATADGNVSVLVIGSDYADKI